MIKRNPINRLRKWSSLFGGIALLSSSAWAELQWDFSGFASYGVGKLSDSALTLLDYTGDHWSSRPDSVLGLQSILQTGDRWSLTGQVVAKGYSFDGRNPYDPRLEWFFVSYEATPDVRLRLGRLRTPHFLYSESLEIGYSYPWVRPPVNMYANFLEPFSNFNGADVTLQKEIGDFENEFKVFAGSEKGKYRGRDVDVEKMAGFTAQSKWEGFTFRYCYNWNRISITDPNLKLPYDLFTSFANNLHEPIFADIADTLHVDGQVFQYHGLGVQWEDGPWTVIAEKLMTQGPDRQFSFENDGRYVTVARQIESFMPYLTVGDYRSQMQHSMTHRIYDSYNVVPARQNGLLDYLRTKTIAGIDDLSVFQRSITLGLRWDFHTNADVKIEAEYFSHLKSTGQMLFDASEPEPHHVLATSLVFDVVF